jgi:hypothetical protein
MYDVNNYIKCNYCKYYWPKLTVPVFLDMKMQKKAKTDNFGIFR